MNDKQYDAFLKDLYQQMIHITVEVWKHYQVKDHKKFNAFLGSINMIVEDVKTRNFEVNLEYVPKDTARAIACECPASVTCNKENIFETNKDEWKVVASVAGSDDTEFMIMFTVKNHHL